MPEGDTVFRTAQRLDAALAGAPIARFDLRVPGSATVDLRGEPVHEVISRGKHLLLRAGTSTLHSHLKMEGRWDVYRPGQKWRRPAFTARAIVGVDTGREGPRDATIVARLRQAGAVVLGAAAATTADTRRSRIWLSKKSITGVPITPTTPMDTAAAKIKRPKTRASGLRSDKRPPHQ